MQYRSEYHIELQLWAALIRNTPLSVWHAINTATSTTHGREADFFHSLILFSTEDESSLHNYETKSHLYGTQAECSTPFMTERSFRLRCEQRTLRLSVVEIT